MKLASVVSTQRWLLQPIVIVMSVIAFAMHVVYAGSGITFHFEWLKNRE